MKLYRFVFIGVVVTIAAVVYVHQRVEIVKTGYALEENRKHLSYLVDQNSKLMYNLSKLESPRYLLASLNGEEVRFANRRRGQSPGSQAAHAGLVSDDVREGFIGKIFDFFHLSAEAKNTD